MTHWKVTIKEVGFDKPIESLHYGKLTYAEVKEFYGCTEPDVEWYKIELIEDE